jgi:hypothetical protein
VSLFAAVIAAVIVIQRRIQFASIPAVPGRRRDGGDFAIPHNIIVAGYELTDFGRFT